MNDLKTVVERLDELLRVAELPVEPNALDGLQVEAEPLSEPVVKVALAVDAAESAIDAAIELGANLLIVHHGLFWGGHRPLRGTHGRKLRKCFAHGLSVYSAHIPLDVHPEVGNNACLAKKLGLEPDGSFGEYRGIEIGLTAPCDLSIEELESLVVSEIGSVRLAGGGPERVLRVGVCSGGGGSLISAAESAGLDALITGEAPHYAAVDAEERGLHLLLAGHYRTETLGVKAVGERLTRELGVEAVFIEHDTGL